MHPAAHRWTWLKIAAVLAVAAVAATWYEAATSDSTAVAPTTIAPEHPAPGSTLLFTATAYCKGTTTASGVRVRSGIAAADPALLPIGSILHLSTGLAEYDGVYSVLDTGPAVKGRALDLYIWSCYEALDFGRRDVEVTVLRLGWDPDASAPDEVADLVRDRDVRSRAGDATDDAATGDAATGDADPPADAGAATAD